MDFCTSSESLGAGSLIDQETSWEPQNKSPEILSLHDLCKSGHIKLVHLYLDEVHLEDQDHNGQTLLDAAFEGKHVDIVQLLLKRGADPQKRKKECQTLLYWACANGDVELAKLLIDCLGENLNLEETGKEGRTFLGWACENGHVEVVQLLIDQGAKLEEKDEDGQTPLHLVCWGTAGNVEIVKLLISQNVNLEEIDVMNHTPVFWACLWGHVSVVKLLLHHKVNINLKDTNGKTPLHLSTQHVEVVQLLLEQKVELNWKNGHDQTALHLACENGNLEVVKLFLEFGAILEEKDKDGLTALHLACKYGHEKIAKLLLKFGANLEARDKFDNTPLHYACQNGNTVIVQLLNLKGVNLEAKTKNGLTPLHVVCSYGYVDLLHLLLVMGRINLEERDSYGNTVFHYAAEQFNTPTSYNLLPHFKQIEPKVFTKTDKGAVAQSLLNYLPSSFVNLPNHKNKIPLQIACEDGYLNVAQILLPVSQGVNLISKN